MDNRVPSATWNEDDLKTMREKNLTMKWHLGCLFSMESHFTGKLLWLWIKDWRKKLIKGNENANFAQRENWKERGTFFTAKNQSDKRLITTVHWV